MIIKIIDSISEWTGRTFSWLATLLVLLICLDVLLRYLFSTSYAAVTELEWHLFSALFLLGAAYTLKHDKHVRVDIFYDRFSEKGRAWVNLAGTLIFLLPFCYVVLVTSAVFAGNSLAIMETSPDPGGLPARFIIKSVIPLGFILLFLQGISLVLKSLKTILQ